MVSLAGAEAAPPLVALINTLQASVTAFNAAAGDNTSRIWKIEIQALVKGKNTTMTLTLPQGNGLSNADSAAILFDIRNILGNQVAIQTNALGAIT